MKHCKTISVVMMLMLSMFAVNASAETKINLTDEIEDVIDFTNLDEINGDDVTYIDYPDIDIKNVKVDKDNNKIDLVLELNEEGDILTSGIFVYLITLKTTENLYEATYATADLNGTEQLVEVLVNQDPDDDVLDDYNIDSNKLTISFDLVDSQEVCIGLSATTTWLNILSGTGTVYIDYIYPEETLDRTVDAGGPYYTETGKNLALSGTINGSDPGYNWIWTFEGITQTKKGKSVTHKFLEPGNFSGTLYVYDLETGKYIGSSFTVRVNGTSMTNNNNNDKKEPGFEIIAFLSAVGIALILLRKRKKH